VIRQALTSVALVAVLAVVAAGCGGSDDETSATQEWADGFCTSLTDWTDALQEIGGTFTDTSSLSADGIKSAVDEAVDATQDFVGNVKSLGPPETESGAEAQSAIEDLADEIDASAEKLEDEFSEGADTLPGALSKVSVITATLSQLSEAVASTFKQLGEIDAQGELEAVLEDTPACQSFTS
jgi:ABC-type transporter Mla subunit MlaD